MELIKQVIAEVVKPVQRTALKDVITGAPVVTYEPSEYTLTTVDGMDFVFQDNLLFQTAQ